METSRPTTLDRPTFLAYEIVHYCVPNMTANIARTSSRALTNAALPYVLELSETGLEKAIRANPGLAEGVYMYKGKMVNVEAGETLGLPTTPLRQLMQ